MENEFCATLVDLLFLMTDNFHNIDSSMLDDNWLFSYNYWRFVQEFDPDNNSDKLDLTLNVLYE